MATSILHHHFSIPKKKVTSLYDVPIETHKNALDKLYRQTEFLILSHLLVDV